MRQPSSTSLLLLWYLILLVASAPGAVLFFWPWKPEAYVVLDAQQLSKRRNAFGVVNGVALRGTACTSITPCDDDPSCGNKIGNRTTSAVPVLPGSFLSGRLYLMGARLTTSYDDDDSSVVITLFGIPGQVKFDWYNKNVCDSELGGSVWSHERTKEDIVMHVQLECRAENDQQWPCGAASPSIEMTRMPTISVDSNVNVLSLIWQANVTEWVDRNNAHGWARSARSKSQPPDGSIRVHFSLTARGPAAAQQQVPTLTNARTTFHPVLSVDIPIATGSVGNVGPGPRTAAEVEVAVDEPTNTSIGGAKTAAATRVSLCVATFGDPIRRYIPEFIRHHKKVGFAPIVLGVLDSDDAASNRMEELQIMLDPYIQDGSVVLIPASAPGMNCHTELLKIIFYNSCLYYSKGIAEYVAVFDLDEYWMPPSNTTAFIDTPVVVTTANTNTTNETVETIQDAMKMVRRYHQIHECSDETWCFHGFPSYNVHRRQTPDGKEVSYKSSNTSLVHLFERRDTKANTVRLKSVAKTKLAYSAGYHEFGSCRNPFGNGPWDIINPGERLPLRETAYVIGDDGDDDPDEKSPCRNLRLLGFGSMHHFQNLVGSRGILPNFQKDTESYRMDEYIQRFVPTDEKQQSAITIQE